MKQPTSIATQGLPFFLVFVAALVRGGLLLLVVLPVVLVTGGYVTTSSTSLKFLAQTSGSGAFIDLVGLWVNVIVEFAGLSGILVLVFVCAAAGVVVTPVERAFSQGITIVVELLLARLRSEPPQLFSMRTVSRRSYVSVLSALFDQPTAKMHWEWELFNFYIYWSVAFHSTLVAGILLRNRAPGLWVVLVILLTSWLIAFALMHGRLMAHVHEFYESRLVGGRS